MPGELESAVRIGPVLSFARAPPITQCGTITCSPPAHTLTAMEISHDPFVHCDSQSRCRRVHGAPRQRMYGFRERDRSLVGRRAAFRVPRAGTQWPAPVSQQAVLRKVEWSEAQLEHWHSLPWWAARRE